MYEQLFLTILLTSVPLILAAMGELVVEKSGILNLGVEGMMLMGAVSAFGISLISGSLILGIFAGAIAGFLISLIFAFFTITLATNQVATGLALTIFGAGLSGLIGAPLVGKAIQGLSPINLGLFESIPFLGLLFKLDVLAYFSIFITFCVFYFLNYSKNGLVLRAVGTSHESAHALGYSVISVRYYAVLFGGTLAGLAGAYLPLVLTPHWSEGMTAGKGWIALALVVFASWQPWRVVAGAILFGGITIMQLSGQAKGWTIPAQFLSMMPYLGTIIVLVLISKSKNIIHNAPNDLGKTFFKIN